jgi:hypothetical protein
VTGVGINKLMGWAKRNLVPWTGKGRARCDCSPRAEKVCVAPEAGANLTGIDPVSESDGFIWFHFFQGSPGFSAFAAGAWV